jgi:DNA-dependent RNA polymerase auxiliary subunit epsilon
MKSVKRQRAKNIDEAIREEIFTILDGWSGRLTWNLFIDKIEARTFQRYSRQTLYIHEDIRNAFENRKANIEFITRKSKKLYGPEEFAESGRNEKLKAENARLKSQVNMLMEKFNRWAINAYQRGLTERDLDDGS